MDKHFLNRIFSDLTFFSVVFAIALILDIVVKIQLDTTFYRYISKAFLMVLLIGYYLKNQQETNRKHFWFMIAALSSFMIGDWLLIEIRNTKLFALGMGFFILGKLFYAFRFSNQRDFKLSRLLPFLFICFFYILWLMNLIYDNLHELFLPVLIYFFVAVIVLQFAFLRKGDVNKLSYILVFIGMIASIVSDSITALKVFYMPNFAYEKITIMLFYGISQYFIILGITKEIKQPEEEILVSTIDYL